MKPKVAVVGAGYWGKNLVRNFYDLGHLSAICDSNEVLARGFHEQYRDIPFRPNYEDLLHDHDSDAVVLATPAVTHYPMARKALLAGKHVFVEKPLALSITEAEELIALATKNSRVLMVGHILQYHNAVLKLKQLIDDGELGKIQYLYSNRLNIGKIRSEENILWSFAPHDISVILMLLHESPEWVFAGGGNYLQHNVADATMSFMSFSSGVKAHIFVSWLHPFKEQKLVIVGDKKMAVFDDTSENKLLLYPHQVKWQNRIPIASKAEAQAVPVEIVEPLRAECQHFISCINEHRTPRTDGEEGLLVLRILNALQQSLDQGGTIVDLTQDKPVKPRTVSRRDTPPEVFVHESSYVDDGVEIGTGTYIWHFSHVLTGSRIGRDCKIGQNVVIGPKVTVGNGCKIQNNVSIYQGVTLEDYVFCGPSMVFTNVFNPRSEVPRMKDLLPTLVKRGATLGANCTIICGTAIGSYAFVAAGAVVTKDVPDFALVQGSPARITGWMCQCGVKLSFDGPQATCQACGLGYTRISDTKIAKESSTGTVAASASPHYA